MRRRTPLEVLILLFFCIAPVNAQTLDEIITRHVAATGGIEKWKSLESLTIISRSDQWSFNLYWKKPNQIRIDVLLGQSSRSRDVRSFDGETGWRINPMEGSEEPRSMSDKETAGLREEGDYLRELIDYKAKGHKVELVGKEVSDGSPAFRLKLTKQSGEIIHIFLDEKTFLEMKRLRKSRSPWGDDVEHAIELGNYRSVGGLMLPHSVGNAVREYEVNKPLDDAFFKMPKKKASDLTEQVRDAEGRARLLAENPEADLDKDGKLTLEEAWVFLKKGKAAQELLPVGSPAPEWTLKDAQGKQHKLSDYRGKVVVIDFWAVWCIPCHQAMPGLQKLHDDLSKRGVVVLGISTGERGGDPQRLMKERGFTYGLLLNGETITEAYHVVGLPTIYVVGVDGRIIHAGFGANEIAQQRRKGFIEDYLTQHGK